ncbi:hypothetical protein AB0B18_15690 [Micromonospora chalcea]
MQTIDVDRETAERALIVIAHHVPLLVDIGRPLLASRDGSTVVVVTTSGTWWVRPGVVERLAELAGGRYEVTRWDRRVELSRTVD